MPVQITFDIEKLNKNDKKLYDQMSDYEKKQFENLWIAMETKKAKLLQLQNSSRDRVQREKKALSEKERRERSHRLIERGAIVESLIPNALDFSNDEIKSILEKALSAESVKSYIASLDKDFFPSWATKGPAEKRANNESSKSTLTPSNTKTDEASGGSKGLAETRANGKSAISIPSSNNPDFTESGADRKGPAEKRANLQSSLFSDFDNN